MDGDVPGDILCQGAAYLGIAPDKGLPSACFCALKEGVPAERRIQLKK